MTTNNKHIVASVDQDGKIVLHRAGFRTTWEDETAVEDIHVRKMHDGWHLVINGLMKEGNSFAFRTPVEFTPDGLLAANAGGITETCKGVGCSHCEFAVLGGCECVGDLLHTCEHTISTLKADEIPLFLKA